MKIVANTASLFTPMEGKKLGLTILPEYVQVENHSYRDYEDISSGEFLEMLKSGSRASTSQPAVGEVIDVLEDCGEETIMLTVADGLSGEYMTAMGTKNTIEEPEHIHILDSRTLGGPLRYLVKKAALLRDQGMPVQEILRRLKSSIDSSVSYVIPADFSYLHRSGRISQMTSAVGSTLKILPILTQSEDRRSISLISVRRSLKASVEMIEKRMQKLHVNSSYLITVAHAGAEEKAERVRGWMQKYFPETETELLELSPSLITHGGPGCILVQAIQK